MNRRGFLRILGMAAAVPAITKVVGPFELLSDRPKQFSVANLNPELEIPYKYGYGMVTVTGILKEVYAPAINDQIFSDMASLRWLSEQQPRGRMVHNSRGERYHNGHQARYQAPQRKR
jgi:hypothetical protein